jgi:hypothetical protein
MSAAERKRQERARTAAGLAIYSAELLREKADDLIDSFGFATLAEMVAEMIELDAFLVTRDGLRLADALKWRVYDALREAGPFPALISDYLKDSLRANTQDKTLESSVFTNHLTSTEFHRNSEYLQGTLEEVYALGEQYPEFKKAFNEVYGRPVERKADLAVRLALTDFDWPRGRFRFALSQVPCARDVECRRCRCILYN